MTGSAIVGRVHHVALQAEHLDQAVPFYTELFGAERLSRRLLKRRKMAK